MLYHENGYVNIPWIISRGLPFTFVYGGRGTGKTYGALDTVLEQRLKFIYLRKSQTQADIVGKPEFSPFSPVAAARGVEITSAPVAKYVSGFYYGREVDGKIQPAGAPIGYCMALSTFSNIRGFDASAVEIMIYDEFIAERHERPIKNEADALFNAYETVNRNRELNGKPPLKLLCLANANTLANPIFIKLELVRKAVDMRKRGQEYSLMPERGIGMFDLFSSEISRAKSDTALYKLTGGSSFAEMAINNKFDDTPSRIRSAPLREYVPLVSVGEITLYRHKGGELLYVTGHKQGTPKTYNTGDSDLARLRQKYRWVWQKYLLNHIEFEDFAVETLFINYFRG